jgi:hypothetical protein
MQNLRNKTALWNNGGSASDTARVALIMNGFTYSFPGGTPSTTFYPSINFPHLDPDYIDDVSGAWDTLTPTYVIPTVGNRTAPYNTYYLSGGSVASTTISESTLTSSAHWQILINTDFPNDGGNDDTDGPNAVTCTCRTMTTALGRRYSGCTPGGGGCNKLVTAQGKCGGDCNTWQSLKSWFYPD